MFVYKVKRDASYTEHLKSDIHVCVYRNHCGNVCLVSMLKACLFDGSSSCIECMEPCYSIGYRPGPYRPPLVT